MTEGEPLAQEPGSRSLLSVGKGTTIMAVSTLLLLVFSFLSRVAVARAFTVETWGAFNYGLALTGFLAITSLLGLHQAIARTLSYEHDAAVRRRMLTVGLGISIAASVVASSLVYFFAAQLGAVFDSPLLGQIFQFLSVTVGFTLMCTFLASIFQGFEDTGPNAIFNQIVNPGLFLLFVLLFLAFHLPFVWVLLAYSLASGVTLGLFVWYSWRRIPKLVPPVPGPKPPLPKNLFGLSVSLWGVTSFQFVTAYVDTILLGAITGSLTQVGLYSAAMTLARLLLVGNGALTYIYLPVAARLKRDGDIETIRTSYVTATRWVLLITMPMLFLFLFLPVQSLHAVFGPNYTGGALALSILVIGSFASVIEGPANSALAGMGYARALLLTTVVAAGVNLGLSLALIPHYGLLGAAVAWAVSRAIYPGLGAYLLYQFDKVTPMRRLLLLPLGVSLAIGAPLFLAAAYLAVPAWTVIPFFFVGAAIFLLAILLTRTVDRGDLTALSALERRLGRSFPALHRFLERFVGPPVPGATSTR